MSSAPGHFPFGFSVNFSVNRGIVELVHRSKDGVQCGIPKLTRALWDFFLGSSHVEMSNLGAYSNACLT